MSKNSRRWCFTFWCEDGPGFDDDHMKYMCYQQEQCPKTKKLHWQGYVEWLKPRGGGWKEAELLFTNGPYTLVKEGKDKIKRKYLNGKFTKANGTGEENLAYCSKSKTAIANTFEEFGVMMPGQGTRKDLIQAASLLEKEGDNVETWRKISWDTCIRYGKALKAAYALKGLPEPERKYKAPIVHILWGKPGTGKSRCVHDALAVHPSGDPYYKVQKLKKDECWWGNYRGEKIVFFDEYEKGMLTDQFLLQLIDWYPMRVKVYYGDAPLMANEFWFTSNTDPKTWMTDASRDGPWHRRLKEFAKIEEYA